MVDRKVEISLLIKNEEELSHLCLSSYETQAFPTDQALKLAKQEQKRRFNHEYRFLLNHVYPDFYYNLARLMDGKTKILVEQLPNHSSLSDLSKYYIGFH